MNAVTAIEERRFDRRMELRIPLEIRGLDDDGADSVVRTVSRNISPKGLFVEVDKDWFVPGQRVMLRLTFPAAEGVASSSGTAACTGEIVRVDRRCAADSTSLRSGLAVRFLDELQLSF